MQHTDKQAYTVSDVAARTGFSARTVTRLFESEPDILVMERAATRDKRRYRSIRIPAFVLQRVLRRLAQ
jgi:hypothetical protein